MIEKEKERNLNRKREKETEIFSMIGFDTATSIFLTLLINKSYRKKTEKGKKKDLKSAIKNSKPFFVSKIMSSNPSSTLENFHWPVMAVKLRKEQKY